MPNNPKFTHVLMWKITRRLLDDLCRRCDRDDPRQKPSVMLDHLVRKELERPLTPVSSPAHH